MKDLKARADEIALEALKRHVANRARAAERAEKLDPDSALARDARRLLQEARRDYDDIAARIAATASGQDDVSAPTAAPVEPVTFRAGTSLSETSGSPASPAGQVDLTVAPASPRTPPPMTDPAEVKPANQSSVERSSIEAAALAAATRTAERAAAANSVAERSVAHVRATLKTVAGDRPPPTPETRSEQPAALPPPAGDHRQTIGEIALPREHKPVREGTPSAPARASFPERPSMQATAPASAGATGKPATGETSLPERSVARVLANLNAVLRDRMAPPLKTQPEQPAELHPLPTDATADRQQPAVETASVPGQVPLAQDAASAATETSTLERPSIEPPVLPVVAEAAEPAAPEDPEADQDVARALATLETVFRDRGAPGSAMRTDEQAVAPQQAASDAPCRHETTGVVAPAVEQMPLAESAAPKQQPEKPDSTRPHDGFPLQFEAPPARSGTPSPRVSDATHVRRPMFGVIASPPDRDTSPKTNADVSAVPPEPFDTVEQQDDAAAPFDEDKLAAADGTAGAAISADQVALSAKPPLQDDDTLSGHEPAAVTKAALQPEFGAITSPESTAHPPTFDTEEDPFDPPSPDDEHFDGFDREEAEKPVATAAHDQPVSASKRLLDEFASLMTRQESPATPEQPRAKQPEAEQLKAERPPENAAVRMLTSDPKQDTFASWLRKWRDGQES